ncbi:helix-turn-helix domain-containing protein [Nannocystis pusilla]|uniref:helix-turn-helix domain-containing protein n=1 Tax=Nannocystis pusilla TaxID=889268 RepID=UPI003DA38489
MPRIILDDLNLARAESILCLEALNVAGDIAGAANLLGITREQLVRKMKRYRILWPAPKKGADGGSKVLAALLAFAALASACGPHPPLPDATSSSESTGATENGSGTSLTVRERGNGSRPGHPSGSLAGTGKRIAFGTGKRIGGGNAGGRAAEGAAAECEAGTSG